MKTKKETIDEAINSLIEKKIVSKREPLFFPLAKDKVEAASLIKSLALKMDITIRNLIWNPEYDNICEWMVNPKKGLLLTGDPGRLKSVFATMILPVLYKIKYGFNIAPIKARQIKDRLESIIKHPVVIIDDVGEEPVVNDFGVKFQPFSQLVDYCEEKSKTLIITTNYDSKVLVEIYGVRPVDRMDKLCLPIKFKGQSFRK